MPDVSESILRTAASWQAFKEGKRLAQSGVVAGVVSTAPGTYTGSVRDGKRVQRVRLIVHSATHIESRCSCPENQSTGTLCAHAVAVGLAASAPLLETGTPQAASAQALRPTQTLPAPTWEIQFPPNWLESLSRGRLSPVLRHTPPENHGDPPDRRLTDWLAAAGASPDRSPQHLHLAGSQLDSFLSALIDHPRVMAAGIRLDLSDYGKFPLRGLTLEGASVRMIPERQAIYPGWLHFPERLVRLHPAVAAFREEVPLVNFLADLETFQQAFEIPPDSFLHSLRFLPARCTIHLHLDGNLESLRATLTVRYGEHPPLPPGQKGPTGLPRLVPPNQCEARDTTTENHAVALLASAGFVESAPGDWSLREPAAILRFLTHPHPDSWLVTESAALTRAHSQIHTLQPKLEFTASGEDWLEVNLSFQSSDGGVLTHAEVQALLRSGRGSRGHRTIASSDTENILTPLLEELEIHQENGRFIARNASVAVFHELYKYLGNPNIPNRLDDIPPCEFSPTVRAEPRPYQVYGLAWLNDRLNRFHGALLADDMGLGKTLQAIALIESMHSGAAPDSSLLTLVVCPTSLIGNWLAEFGRFAPGRPVQALHGAGRDALRGGIQAGTVVLTSFATLARDLAWHLRQDYHLVVVDEASLMRNPDTDHAKALCKLRATHRLALTGTPMENGVRDLWSIFRFLLPGWLGERTRFRERYEAPLTATPPDPDTLTRLRLKTSPFLLRRTKSQVASELPAKLIIDEFCDLSVAQQATYQQLLREGRERVESSSSVGQNAAARMHLLTSLLRLRQACCDLALLQNERFQQMSIPQRSAKLERLLELLETALSENSKVLVFSQFRTQLQEIEKQLTLRGWPSLRLDGQSRERQNLVDRFHSADGPPIFLISLKAGGYGLNLTAADTVIHFDPWWNPAAEMQATDRAHRIGQTRPVTVYRLLTRHTVEEKVLRLQSRKRDLAAWIDESGASDCPSLSVADLQSLLD